MANPQTPNDWKKAIGRFEASGLTQVDFCKREGIGLWSFRKWRKRMAEPEGRELGFIEVTPVPVQRIPQRYGVPLEEVDRSLVGKSPANYREERA